MRVIAVLFALFFIFLLAAKPVLAVSVTINNFPPTITDEAFTITASISGATAGTNYLRIDIYKDGTSNYFGETYNNADWYGGSTYSQYLPITIQSGVVWNGSIQGRVGSPTTGQYDGNDTYKLKIRRYTSAGGYTSTESNNSAVTVSIILPTPTVTPTEIPTSAPTATLTPLPTPSKTPTPKPSVSPTPIKSLTPTKESQKNEKTSSEVLGSSAQNDTPADDESSKQTKTQDTNTGNLVGNFFIILGIIFTALCGIVFSWPYRHKITERFRK